jgi:exosome complex RNA-binding protein Rrp42 (RNase PH superfamily)
VEGQGRRAADEYAPLSALITGILRRSLGADLAQLCVVEGRIVWAVYVEITCLEDDGTLEDAALLAAVAALRNRM